MSWQDKMNEEERLQVQYHEYRAIEVTKMKQAYDAGDNAAARKHLNNAKRYQRMAEAGVKRMRKILAPPSTRATLWDGLLSSFRSIIKRFKG